MEASLTCAVCLGVFRDPVTLPLCSHNFCKSCVAECAEPHSRHFPHTSPVAVPCPLCRKVSSIHGGLSALPINTTLAELARMLAPTVGSATAKEESPPRGAESPLTGHCPEHPEHRLELFCKNCARACCGKCVSSAHQGIFHSVNLLDMVYQEEKLMYFNSLKKLREMYEKVTKEGPGDDHDVKDTLQKNTDVVNSAFDEVQKALELKRQHLLDFIKQQENTAIKRHEVWKRTAAHHKITLEHLLKDSEAIVDEVEPKCFLKVSCSLNKRMKSYLDLVELSASHCPDTPKTELNRMDLKPVIDAISDLKITTAVSNDPSKGNGDVSFKTLTRTWGNQHTPTQKYSELRMKYYEDSSIQENNETLLTEQGAAAVKDAPHQSRCVDATKMNSAEIKRPAFGGACSNFKPKPELVPKSIINMETGQKDGLFPSGFTFSKVVADSSKEPISCFLSGATGGVSTDVKGAKETRGIKETNRTIVAPAFCLGRTDAAAVSKPGKNERIFAWKKPKTAALPTTSVTFQSSLVSTNKPDFIFGSIGHSNETKDTSFCSPFTHREPKAQENEVPGDLAAQANGSEEFFDAVSNANSDAEETTETRTFNSAG